MVSDQSTRPPALRDRIAERPVVAAGLVLLAVLVVAYAVLLRQELFVVIWFGFVGFFGWLFYRFIVAFERIAGAAERLADSEE